MCPNCNSKCPYKRGQKWIYNYILQNREENVIMEAEIGAIHFDDGGKGHKPGITSGH